MEPTPTLSRFDDAYKTRSAPWVIGEPQPAIVALERTGPIRSPVLDVGCGTGEHTILLSRLGYDVVGLDAAPTAIERARANAAAKLGHGSAKFLVGDAMRLADQPTYQTILDSALFHIFDDTDRPRYVAGLHRACRPGGLVFVLALSDRGRGFGPQVGEAVIREAFTDGWRLEELTETTYRGVVQQIHADALGLPVGTVVDEPAWLARVRRL